MRLIILTNIGCVFRHGYQVDTIASDRYDQSDNGDRKLSIIDIDGTQ